MKQHKTHVFISRKAIDSYTAWFQDWPFAGSPLGRGKTECQAVENLLSRAEWDEPNVVVETDIFYSDAWQD